jgi:hypothetical protein
LIPTVGPIERLLTEDHVRLSRLLERADRQAELDVDAFEEFRRGLLRHIGMEEKVLLPAARKHRPVEIAAALRKDHGVIAKLLVPSPTHALCEELREVLGRHNGLEEGEGGLYALCDVALFGEIEEILQRLRNYPEVPAAKHYDGPLLRR